MPDPLGWKTHKKYKQQQEELERTKSRLKRSEQQVEALTDKITQERLRRGGPNDSQRSKRVEDSLAQHSDPKD